MRDSLAYRYKARSRRDIRDYQGQASPFTDEKIEAKGVPQERLDDPYHIYFNGDMGMGWIK